MKLGQQVKFRSGQTIIKGKLARLPFEYRSRQGTVKCVEVVSKYGRCIVEVSDLA